MIVAAVPTQQLADAIGPVEGRDRVVWLGGGLRERADGIGCLVPDYIRARTTLRQLGSMPRLRAVQLQTAGYDAVAHLVPPGLDLLSARGVHDDATAELALGLTIASLRGI